MQTTFEDEWENARLPIQYAFSKYILNIYFILIQTSSLYLQVFVIVIVVIRKSHCSKLNVQTKMYKEHVIDLTVYREDAKIPTESITTQCKKHVN